MGTEEYLNKLNRDQLCYARDESIRRIAELDLEQKRVVWRVEDRYACLDTFPDTDYIRAAFKLLEIAKENASCPKGNLKPKDMELHLVSISVPESEYKDWI